MSNIDNIALIKAKMPFVLLVLITGLILLFPNKSYLFIKETKVTSTVNNVYQLKYFLKVANFQEHLFEIKIQVVADGSKELKLAIPAWSPGRYVIHNFAKNVQDFSVQTLSGKKLSWQKIDKQTWNIDCQGETKLEINYKVFANDLSGTFSQIDQEHANFNGASIFMYVVDHKQDPIELQIEKPNSWKIINSASDNINQSEFRFSNYDLLIDTPTEMGKFELETFQVNGFTCRVALHSYLQINEKPKLIFSIKQIVEAQTKFLGTPDSKHYTFLVHIVSSKYPTDGMEHLNSTQIIETNIDDVIETVSHEFFHLWNVKRLRPIELGPWNYNQEVYTKSLWIAEGLTSYYGDLFLARSSNWSQKKFYSFLSEQINTLQSQNGRKQMSLEQSSLDTWLFLATPKAQSTNEDETTISYYNKGEIVGLMLDLEIRHRTANLKSLDDVLFYLYTEYYLNSPQETYYLKGRGYVYEDFLKAVNKVSESDFTEFFKSYVSGTEELNYNAFLFYAGLYLQGSGHQVEIKELPKATDQQIKIRNSWLWLSNAAKAATRN